MSNEKANQKAAAPRPLTDAELNMTPAEWAEAFAEDPSCIRTYLEAAIQRGREEATNQPTRTSIPHAGWCDRLTLPPAIRDGVCQRCSPVFDATQGGRSMNLYSVNVYDRAGLFRRTECATWTDCLVTYDAERVAYPDKPVHVFNLDRCDYNTDGLTDEEREALDERPGNAAQPPEEPP